MAPVTFTITNEGTVATNITTASNASTPVVTITANKNIVINSSSINNSNFKLAAVSGNAKQVQVQLNNQIATAGAYEFTVTLNDGSTDITTTKTLTVGVAPVTFAITSEGTVATNITTVSNASTPVVTITANKNIVINSSSINDNTNFKLAAVSGNAKQVQVQLNNQIATAGAYEFTVTLNDGSTDITTTKTLTVGVAPVTFAITDEGTVATNITTASNADTPVVTITANKDIVINSSSINNSNFKLIAGSSSKKVQVQLKNQITTAGEQKFTVTLHDGSTTDSTTELTLTVGVTFAITDEGTVATNITTASNADTPVVTITANKDIIQVVLMIILISN